VRAVVILPLLDRDRIVGVLAVLDRDIPSDAQVRDLRLMADVAAARLRQLRDHQPIQAAAAPSQEPAKTMVVTRAELRALERQNIEAALAHTDGKIFGTGGAAALLGMKPTTLASRIKALGIRER
jgi:transcriptional regulator with GAF, ATPase, and Fis domain